MPADTSAQICDVLVLADAGNWSVGVPGLTYSLRGLSSVDVGVRALDGPVHSGMAGGAVPDPVLALSRLLASLVDEQGDAAFDDCWLDYQPPDDAERARLAALPDDTDDLRHAWGARGRAGKLVMLKNNLQDIAEGGVSRGNRELSAAQCDFRRI